MRTALFMGFVSLAVMGCEEEALQDVDLAQNQIAGVPQTNGHDPVVAITIDSSGRRCTGVAIAHDVLATAAHCFRGFEMAVQLADGANASAIGARSAFGVFPIENPPNNLFELDFFFAQFPPNTFNSTYNISFDSNIDVGSPIVVVGYSNLTKEEVTINVGAWEIFEYENLEFGRIISEPDSLDLELGDSGGPLLSNGVVVGVASQRVVADRALLAPWFRNGAADVLNSL